MRVKMLRTLSSPRYCLVRDKEYDDLTSDECREYLAKGFAVEIKEAAPEPKAEEKAKAKPVKGVKHEVVSHNPTK